MTVMGAQNRQVANPTYTPIPASPRGYSSFDDFYPYYLGEHSTPICRRLHLVGTSISSIVLARVFASYLPLILPDKSSSTSDLRSQLESSVSLARPAWQYIAAGVGQGYFMAWIGHFFFEHNKPATFKYPAYSFLGDLRMLWEVVTFKRNP